MFGSDLRQGQKVVDVRKFGLLKIIGNVFAFCAIAVLASPAQTVTTLVNFGGTNGSLPYAGLVQSADGNFYGTTEGGGDHNYGTVFKITSAGALTTLYSFGDTDGASPWAGLVQAADGNFYGTTTLGGTSGQGTVFKITPSGTLTTLHTFLGTDGGFPHGGLVQGTDGYFYGTTLLGGARNFGTVFKITSAGALSTLYSFAGMDGAYPWGGLVQATDGNFYGTTNTGGSNSQGTVFKITPSGTLTTLHSFVGTDGSAPYGDLVQASDGNFYGTTNSGGSKSQGTVFEITPSGTLTTLHSFVGTDGSAPYGDLVQATDGNFYGTTNSGGSNSQGTVFEITPSGTLTTLHSFVGTDGSAPYAGLVQATDGNFYGTTNIGGSNSQGTVFSVSLGPVRFVAVPACRLLDTRTQSGGGGPIPGDTVATFNLPQLAQTQGCANLSSAAAYSLNVTLVPQNGNPVHYLTIWPTGELQPYVSTMNSDGRIKANAAIVSAGVGGAVSVYVTDASDLVLDTDGYFAPVGQSTLAFYPLPPCRVADTRNPPGDLGGPSLTGGVPRSFPVLEATTCNIPSTAQAYSLNFTAVPPGPLGYLTVWPTGQSQPYVSTLNAPTGTVVANAAIVPAGTSGGISTYAYNDTDLVIDIDGYFAPPTQGGLSLYPLAPCRILDTRNGSGAFSGTLSPPVDVLGSPCGIPSQSQAYVLNATVVPVGSLGYLTLWPDGEQQPYVSTLNAYDGAITSNMAIVPAGNHGKIDAYASGPGTTNLILDISSYFAP